MAAEEQRSMFAEVLRELLDETGVLSRAEWATTLGVTKQAISQWVNDKTIPRPHVLQGILDFFAYARGGPREIVDRFHQLARMDSREVSPHADRLGPTVGDYLLEPLMRGFFRSFNPLSAVYKAEVLYQASELCHDFARLKVDDDGAKASPHPLEQLLYALREVPEDRRQRVITAMLTSLSRNDTGPGALLMRDVERLFGDSPDAQVFEMLITAQSDVLDWDLLVQSTGLFRDDPPKIEMLISALHSFLSTHGCRGLCTWYTLSVEAGGEAVPHDFAILEAGLRYHLVVPGALAEHDSYAILVGHQLRARDRPLTPEELLRIGGLVAQTSEKLVFEALHNIWGLRERLLIDNPKFEYPWGVGPKPKFFGLPVEPFTLFTELDSLQLVDEEQEANAEALIRVEIQAQRQTPASHGRVTG